MVGTIDRGGAVPEAIELNHEQCLRLLSAGVTGRVAVSTPDGPHIVPVNYSVVGEAVVLRTTPYSVLGSHGRGAMLAFEVDGVDHDRWRGWSVVARGRAEAVTDPVELERIRAVWEPRPWVSGSRALHLRIPWTELSGRQIGVGWDPVATLPVRRAV
jgi:nitroimidazol reductase NimA-like FMN-containing flavoprotein (pyridoxamine 5'-phosphate oxidase superfamily)